MVSGSWVDDLEDAIATAAADLVAFISQTLAVVGSRPLGMVEGDRWTQLEQWLAIRDDPQAWTQTIAQWAQEIGVGPAVVLAVREATRLEGMLLRLGRWDGTPDDAPRAALDGARAVRLHAMARRLGRATRLVDRAEALRARGPVMIQPPLPPQADDLTAGTLPSLLTGWSDSLAPITPTAADLVGGDATETAPVGAAVTGAGAGVGTGTETGTETGTGMAVAGQ